MATVTDQDLKDLGALIIAARRRVWDLERELPRSLYSASIKEDLRHARREYRKLLERQRQLIDAIQGRLL